MALTVTGGVTNQIGRHFTFSGLVASGAAAAASVVLVDFSSNLNAQPLGTSGPTFTCFKLTKLQTAGLGLGGSLADHHWYLAWDAGTDVPIIYMSGWSPLDLDFTPFPQGGIVNTKASGYTGDLMIYIAGTVASGDTISIILEGELTP